MAPVADAASFLMPCVWDCHTLEDGSTVQILTNALDYVWPPGGDWSQPLAHSPSAPPPGVGFRVVRVAQPTDGSATCPAPSGLWEDMQRLAIRHVDKIKQKVRQGMSPRGRSDGPPSGGLYAALCSPEGRLVAATADGAVTAVSAPAGGGGVPLSAIFRVDFGTDGTATFWSENNRLFLGAGGGGTDVSLRQPRPSAEERFRVRQVALVPKFIGPNLGGWLVTERWMVPPQVWEGVSEELLGDGTCLNIQSLTEGKFCCAEGGGGGEVNANRDGPSGWESFTLRRAAPAAVQLRADGGQFWSVTPGSNLVVADKVWPGAGETFGIRIHGEDRTKFQLRAGNGSWVRVAPGGAMYADTWEEAPAWDSSCTLVTRVWKEGVNGEVQLIHRLGREEAARRLTIHRDTWVTEEDFAWMAAHGVTAVRVPVGFWIAEDPTPEPFIPGTLACLDKAFRWGETHGIRLLLCLHAAPGSQNGWDHSCTRDGRAEWCRDGSGNVERSLHTLSFLARRYGGSRQLAGIQALNEPMSGGAARDVLAGYYQAAYGVLREHAPAAYLVIMAALDEADPAWWDNFMTGPEHTNVVLDEHIYQTGVDMASTTVEAFCALPLTEKLAQVKRAEHGQRLVFIGEWTCSFPGTASDEAYTEFGRNQISAYAAGASAGCFFWSIKNGGGSPSWSFRDCVERGWLRPEWWHGGGGGGGGGGDSWGATRDRSEL